MSFVIGRVVLIENRSYYNLFHFSLNFQLCNQGRHHFPFYKVVSIILFISDLM